jgi:CRISPR-associated protein Cas4
LVKASGISEFLFCERAWWLRQHNYFGKLGPLAVSVTTERMESGTEYHQRYFTDVRSASRGRRTAHTLIVISVVLLLFALLLFLIDGAHASPAKHRAAPKRADVQNGTAPATADRTKEPTANVAGMILFGAFALILISLALKRTSRRRENRWRMPAGSVVSVDDETHETLVCHTLGLTGRPDVVRKRGSGFAPEEVKSGTLSEGRTPHRGHILQLAAYCYLVEKNRGPVQCGILIYRDRRIEISFTDELRSEMRMVVNRMASLQSAQAVHRSHQKPARCSACQVRSICFEALA